MNLPPFLTSGPQSSEWTIVLAHGAGAAMDSPFMERMAEGLAAGGLRVVRFEFPYMQARREGQKKMPDREPILRATWEAVIESLGPRDRLIIGGKSMGGRIASMIADDCKVAGLVCLGYPFHPPGKPTVTRVTHLSGISTPTLVVQGTRDALGAKDEITAYRLSPQIRFAWIEDGDHSFKPRVRSGRTTEQNLGEAVQAVSGFVNSLAPAVEGSSV